MHHDLREAALPRPHHLLLTTLNVLAALATGGLGVVLLTRAKANYSLARCATGQVSGLVRGCSSNYALRTSTAAIKEQAIDAATKQSYPTIYIAGELSNSLSSGSIHGQNPWGR